MKKLKRLFLILFTTISISFFNTKIYPEFCNDIFNFYDWEAFNNIINPDPAIFYEIIQKFNTICLEQVNDDKNWPTTKNKFWENFNSIVNELRKNENSNYRIIFPHVCAFKQSPDEKTYIIGDIHGNKEFLKIIKNLIEKDGSLSEELKLSNANIIFLGDYVDRGSDGITVLTTAMILKIINPNNVILLRGNHENIDMNNAYNFIEEINKKLKTYSLSFIRELEIAYELMPSACYLTADKKKFIHLSHAGFEFRFNPSGFLKKLNEQRLHFSHISIKKSEELPSFLLDNKYYLKLFSYNTNNDPLTGFLWNDITKKYLKSGDRGANEIKYGEEFLEDALKEYKLSNTFIKFIRGHQHKLPKKNKYLDQETSGATDIGKKIVTLISTTINVGIPAWTLKFLPTYLEISFDENKIFYRIITCN